MEGQTAVDIFAPFRRLAEFDGAVVMMGVGLDSLTLLHHAEEVTGRNLFMRWANGPDGSPIGILGGGCSRGFPNLEPALNHLIRRTQVGESRWMILPAGEAIATASRLIWEQPSTTHCGKSAAHCGKSDCLECNDAILGGPNLEGFV